VLGLSLFLRLYDLDVFLSGDETKWMCRGINFHAALARGELSDTYQSEHPGVLTMWIATLAVPLSRVGEWVDLCAWVDEESLLRVENHPAMADLPALVFRARQWLTVVTWLGMIGMWWLFRRLTDGRTALLGAVFIGLDPFYLALSRVLHLDALLTTFMSLSVLSMLVYLRGHHRFRYLACSALTAGLAMANKSPALFLGPWVGLLVLGFVRSTTGDRWHAGVRCALRIFVPWGVIALGVVVLLWPALWSDPTGALSQVFGQALGYADQPHGHSNFFWGQVRPDPGPAFYPVAWAFRTTPWAMLGLLLLLLRWRNQWRCSHFRSLVVVFGGFVLLYGALMTLGAKKFDRYLLPVFPFVDLLAAIGWAELLRHWLLMAESRWHRWLLSLLILTLLMAQFAVLWPTRPYYFSYYNPLLGGGRTAQQILLVGWGEGLEKAAAYLNAEPGAEHFDVSTEHRHQFGPFFQGRTSGAKRLDVAHGDYYVLYVNTIQRWRVPRFLE
jgi:4-amino-4-deoxy-L-arabinose transferase-like glycosyltransferase